MTREQFIEKNSSLFWYTPQDKKSDVNDTLLIERVLNDGSLSDFSELTKLLGARKIAEIFFSLKGREKLNYYPEIYHFYSLLLAKYAQGDI